MSESKLVLVIEDNHDMRVCLREQLESAGFTVWSVANGKDALSLLKNGFLPKVIILDLNMPIMTGEEFLKSKKRMPSIDSVPVLIISGRKPTIPDLGNCFFEKPLNWKILTNAVDVFAVGA